MSILQKRLLKFGKKRANTIMQRILFFIKKFDCILFFTKNIWSRTRWGKMEIFGNRKNPKNTL